MTTKSSRLTPEREKEIREIIFNKENVPLPGTYFVAGYDLLQEIDALRAENASLKLRLGELSPDAKISWGHTGPCQPGCNCIDAQAAQQPRCAKETKPCGQ